MAGKYVIYGTVTGGTRLPVVHGNAVLAQPYLYRKP